MKALLIGFPYQLIHFELKEIIEQGGASLFRVVMLSCSLCLGICFNDMIK